MKTAEELFKDWSGSSYNYEALSNIERQRWVSFSVIYNNRQLDAWKQGMSDAYSTPIDEYPHHLQRHELESAFDDGVGAKCKAILTARDNKTSL